MKNIYFIYFILVHSDTNYIYINWNCINFWFFENKSWKIWNCLNNCDITKSEEKTVNWKYEILRSVRNYNKLLFSDLLKF
jgi:hypothetical protein